MSRSHLHGASQRDARSVFVALILILAFFVVELVSAILGSSLVLLADAVHMLTDISALAMSAWAIHLARRPPELRFTYGLRRAEILSAAANGLTLVAVGIFIAIAAIHRLIDPRAVNGGLILIIALVGCGVNLGATRALARADRANLNVRGAYLHILTDLYAFGAAAVAGAVILGTHWARADAVASLLVTALMGRAAYGLLRDAGRILLQGTPLGLDLDDVRSHLIRVERVLDVHDLHAWSVSSDDTTLSAHVVIDGDCFRDGRAPQILDQLQSCLSEHFRVEHATFQLEPDTHESHEDGLHP